jgi:hypothetical protein
LTKRSGSKSVALYLLAKTLGTLPGFIDAGNAEISR